jgi:integrase
MQSKSRFVNRYSCYETFCKSVRNDVTRKKYIEGLNTFLAFCDFTRYEQLLEISDTEKFEAIREFLLYLDTERRLASSTINNHYYPIKLFYEINNVLLNWKQLSRSKPRLRHRADDRLYTDEEIKKYIDHASVREKAVILTLLSTGMRIGGLASIRLKDITYLEDYHLYKFRVYSDDLTDRYTTFCTPEAANAINLYLDYRRTYEAVIPESPLIAESVNPQHLFSPGKDNSLTSDAIAHMVRRLQWKANIFKRQRLLPDHSNKGRIHKPAMTCHSFRKIFNTRCIEQNVNLVVKETLLGHKAKLGLDIHYFRPTEQQLLNEYLKVIDALTVNEENRLKLENRHLKQEKDRHQKIMLDILDKFERWEKTVK